MGFCTQVVEKRRMKHRTVVGEGKCVYKIFLQQQRCSDVQCSMFRCSMFNGEERWRGEIVIVVILCLSVYASVLQATDTPAFVPCVACGCAQMKSNYFIYQCSLRNFIPLFIPGFFIPISEKKHGNAKLKSARHFSSNTAHERRG